MAVTVFQCLFCFFALQTEMFVHSFKDQLVSNALLALYTARPGCANMKLTDPRNSPTENDLQGQDNALQICRQDSIPHHSEYDEEEWVSNSALYRQIAHGH